MLSPNRVMVSKPLSNNNGWIMSNNNVDNIRQRVAGGCPWAMSFSNKTILALTALGQPSCSLAVLLLRWSLSRVGPQPFVNRSTGSAQTPQAFGHQALETPGWRTSPPCLGAFSSSESYGMGGTTQRLWAAGEIAHAELHIFSGVLRL